MKANGLVLCYPPDSAPNAREREEEKRRREERASERGRASERAEVSEKEGVDGGKKEEREPRTWTQAGFGRLMSRDIEDGRIKEATAIKTSGRRRG